VATVHPSAVLRERADRKQAYNLFVDDLHNARAGLAAGKSRG
jgi:hypothetical protein